MIKIRFATLLQRCHSLTDVVVVNLSAEDGNWKWGALIPTQKFFAPPPFLWALHCNLRWEIKFYFFECFLVLSLWVFAKIYAAKLDFKMSKEYVGIQEITVLVICVIKVSGLFSQNVQIPVCLLVVFCKLNNWSASSFFFILQNPRGGNCLLLPVTGQWQ